MARVDDDEVLLLWRSLSRFRSGDRPSCRPQMGRSECPLIDRCPRWSEPDSPWLRFEESFDDAEKRRASWPCGRLLNLLGPEIHRISR